MLSLNPMRAEKLLVFPSRFVNWTPEHGCRYIRVHAIIRDKQRRGNQTKLLLYKDIQPEINFREYLIIFRFLIFFVLSMKIKIKNKQSLTYYNVIN